MGLDMYLRAEKYVSGYRHRDESERDEYATLVRVVRRGGLRRSGHPLG